MKNAILKRAFFLSFLLHATIVGLHHTTDVFEGLLKISNTKLNSNKNVSMKIKMTPYRQIVQTQDSNNKEALDKSFLGKSNNSFDRQTTAKVIDNFRITKGKSSQQRKVENSTTSSSVKKSKGINLANLGVGIPVVAKTGKTLGKDSSNDKDEKLLREVSSLASASNDYVKDIPLADISMLNTTEYKHFGFFQRIRSQLEQHWGTTLKEKAKKIYKSGRKISSDSDFITNIEVVLDQRGMITGINIIGTSGVKELDDAAIESFNKAGPFPNPPSDLLSNGIAKIKWGFVVKS